MTSKSPDQRASVWLILAKVEVFDGNPANLTGGSQALVQCFVPESDLETAIGIADELLIRERMRRIGIVTQTQFVTDEEFVPETPDFVKRDVLQAARSGKAFTGTFFTSKESASFKD